MVDRKSDVTTTRSRANDLKLKLLSSCDSDFSIAEDGAHGVHGF